jgi:hypothetical protein
MLTTQYAKAFLRMHINSVDPGSQVRTSTRTAVPRLCTKAQTPSCRWRPSARTARRRRLSAAPAASPGRNRSPLHRRER